MQMSHLRYFAEIARVKNMTLAAKNLHVSQPSLTYAVRVLENELGVPLLFRHPHSISLTEAGETFAAQAERITASADNLAGMMKGYAGLTAGNLRLGVLWIGGYMEIFTLLNEFRGILPGVTYELSFDGSDILIDSLKRRCLHGIFVVSSPAYLENEKDFHSVRISAEEYKLIIPKSNPLSQKSAVSIRDLDRETIIMPSEKTLLYRQLSVMFQAEGVSPRVLCSTSQSDIAGQLAGAGLGIAFASSTVAGKICGENCRVIDFGEGAKIHRIIYFLMPREFLDYPLTRAFFEFAEKKFSGHEEKLEPHDFRKAQ